MLGRGGKVSLGRGGGVRRCGSLLPLSFRSYVALAKPPRGCELYFTLLRWKWFIEDADIKNPRDTFSPEMRQVVIWESIHTLVHFSVRSWIRKPRSAKTAPKTVSFQSLDPSLPGLSAVSPQLPLPKAHTWLASLTPALPHQPVPHCRKLSPLPLLLFVQAQISLANYDAAQTPPSFWHFHWFKLRVRHN